MADEQCTGPFSDARDCPVHRPPRDTRYADILTALLRRRARLAASYYSFHGDPRFDDKTEPLLRTVKELDAILTEDCELSREQIEQRTKALET